jgi:hypothetical protein
MAGGTVPSNGLTKGSMHSPLRSADMPQAPTAGATRQSLVLQNQRPIVVSQPDRDGNFVFQKDSAGMGVPRGSLGNLNHVSNDVGRHGSASMPVYASAPGSSDPSGANNHNRGPVTLRQASPGDGQQGAWRGNPGAATASGAHQSGGFGGAQGASGAQPSSRGGGGGSAGGGMQPGAPSASGPAGSGGGRQSAPAPK